MSHRPAAGMRYQFSIHPKSSFLNRVQDTSTHFLLSSHPTEDLKELIRWFSVSTGHKTEKPYTNA
jgi:hypothetical protein